MRVQIEEFIEHIKIVKQASHNTIISYQKDLERFCSYLLSYDMTAWSDVTETTIHSYVLELERKFSNATVARHIVSLKGFFSFLIKRHCIDTDPCERIMSPKVDKKAPRTLSIEDVENLLNLPDCTIPKGIRDKAMLELMYATGMKASELLELKLENIDFQHGILICQSNKKERVLPFGQCAGTILKQYITEARNSFDGVSAHSYVFVNYNGKPLTRQGFWKILKEYANVLGIEHVSPQILRHTFARHLINNGANVNIVGEMLGYTDHSLAYIYADHCDKRILEEYRNSHPRA